MTRLTGLVSKEDLDQLEITYEDLAKVYFFLGKTNGKGASLWQNIKHLLDESQTKDYSFVTEEKYEEGLRNYCSLQQEWENLLLTQEPEVNENQELIDELNSVIMKAQEQIEILTTKEEV